MKKIIFFIIVIVLLLGGLWYYFSDTQIVLDQTEREELVTQYLRDNLTELSSEEAVLGGTFYPTRIEFVNDNSGLIDYEDGHIALTARFVYEVNLGRVSIVEFEVLPGR